MMFEWRARPREGPGDQVRPVEDDDRRCACSPGFGAVDSKSNWATIYPWGYLERTGAKEFRDPNSAAQQVSRPSGRAQKVPLASKAYLGPSVAAPEACQQICVGQLFMGFDIVFRRFVH